MVKMKSGIVLCAGRGKSDAAECEWQGPSRQPTPVLRRSYTHMMPMTGTARFEIRGNNQTPTAYGVSTCSSTSTSTSSRAASLLAQHATRTCTKKPQNGPERDADENDGQQRYAQEGRDQAADTRPPLCHGGAVVMVTAMAAGAAAVPTMVAAIGPRRAARAFIVGKIVIMRDRSRQ